jgi:LacI family transcriptional regulator
MAHLILLTDFSEEFAKRLLKGIVQYSKERQPWVLCKMPLSFRDMYGIEGVIDWAKRWKANAIIAQFYNTDNVRLFKENGIVAVAQDFKSRFTEIPNITGEYHLVGKMGADYFIRKGFTNFAYYGFKNIEWSRERFEGFRNELSRHGLENSLYEYRNEDFKELWYYESEPLVAWLKSLPKPVALMVCEDNQGYHITELCKQHRIKIPDDISLLGVDNDETVCMLSDPPLSSIDMAVEKGGYDAALLIDKMIGNPDSAPENVMINPTRIITRQSTDIYATSDKYIAVVLKYIHQNANKKICIDDLTRLVPLSRRLLEDRFKTITGMPVYSYIINLRIEKFAFQLLETNRPIIEIAEEICFLDYKNVARQFFQIKNCTPSEFRKKHLLKYRRRE